MAVRVESLDDLLNEIRDVFCVVCNTIMTADIVLKMTKRPQPVIWILHEWWDEAMIIENLRVRNIEHLSIHTVRQAMKDAAMIVFVCEAQRQLYSPSARSQVIYVGVPDPSCRYRYVALRLKAIQDSQPKTGTTSTDSSEHHVGMHRGSLSVPPPFVSEATIETRTSPSNRFVFLCLGIVCPRKNQLWTVELFQVRTAYRASTVLYDGCMVCVYVCVHLRRSLPTACTAATGAGRSV